MYKQTRVLCDVHMQTADGDAPACRFRLHCSTMRLFSSLLALRVSTCSLTQSEQSTQHSLPTTWSASAVAQRNRQDAESQLWRSAAVCTLSRTWQLSLQRLPASLGGYKSLRCHPDC